MPRRSALTDKQRVFCQEYLVDLCATQAAIRAGYSKNMARSIGCENLTKPNIQAYIQKLMAARAERTKISADMVVEELRRIGFVDIRQLFDEAGSVRLPGELDPDTAAAIGSVKTRETRATGESDGRQIEYKLESKIRALELLGRHLGIWDSKQAKQPSVTVVLSKEDQKVL